MTAFGTEVERTAEINGQGVDGSRNPTGDILHSGA